MQPFDRAAEDLGNSIHLEHVNVTIPDQRLATLFYGAGLGLTRDPYLMVSDNNMWINVGRSQFHLPTGKPQVLRGHTGIVIEGREALLDAARVRREAKLAGHQFDFTEHNDYVEATCPGATASAATSRTPRASAASISAFPMSIRRAGRHRQGICAFYPAIMGMQAEFLNGDSAVAKVKVGKDQVLLFRETDTPQPEFDGHHVQIYIRTFQVRTIALRERGLVTQEDNQYQYRFRDIIDLDGGKHLFTIEHEQLLKRAEPLLIWR